MNTTNHNANLLNFKLDDRQRTLIELFVKLAESLNKQSVIINVLAKFTKPKHPKGVYLHGDVGRGKTMLMNAFYDKLLVKKDLVHFQNFMQEVHQKLHKFQLTNQDTDKLIKQLADHIASRVKVLCIDEFEVKDIADAMLVMKLFSSLSDKGVFIFLTTNTQPDNLYKDGLQRGSFLPFIAAIKKDFTVLGLQGEKDYRFTKAASVKNKIVFPINKETKEIIAGFKEELCSKQELHPGGFKVFGREVEFDTTHENILFTNFDELFTRNLGYTDYVNLCQRFNIIVLENLRQISEDETDIITRVINFIDNAYFYKIVLFASLETKPSLLYTSGKRIKEFQRAVSRLHEMSG